MSDIYEVLGAENIECEKAVLLSSHSSFKVGGKADCVAYPKNEYELIRCIEIAKIHDNRFEIIGNGSNILFSDRGFGGLIICTKKMTFITADGVGITAQCGARLSSISALARDNSLSGLEFAHGIPGTVGGAVAMNAGAFGGEMSDVVISSRVLNVETGEIFTIDRADHEFCYRESIYSKKKNLVCTLVNFELSVGDKNEIDTRMKANAQARREKQPLNIPNCGSYFKRPEGYIAAKLIDDLGLKGKAVGGAMISKKHAGFIVNTGNATSADILTLEEIVKNEVLKKYGVLLEREVKYVE